MLLQSLIVIILSDIVPSQVWSPWESSRWFISILWIEILQGLQADLEMCRDRHQVPEGPQC